MKKKDLKLMSQILELSSGGALLLDARKAEVPVVFVNQVLAELSGFSAAEMIGQPWHRFSVEDHQPVKDADENQVPANRLLSRNQQGGAEGIRLEMAALYDDKGKPAFWYATVCESGGSISVVNPAHPEDATLAMRKRAGRDAATGLYDNDTFNAVLQREWVLAAREQRELAMIVIGVDYFTDYLDVFGKHAGDACLRKVGHAISGSLRRSGDVSARLNDDRFVVLLTDTSAENAKVVADRITEKVRGLAVHHPRSAMARFVTVSCGVAGIEPDWDTRSDELLAHAEGKLNKGFARSA